MIDTIEFGIAREYEIQPNNKLVLRRDTNQETGAVFEKFYFNDDVLNLTIDNNKGLAIKTNLSKLYGLGDNNLYPLGANSFEACLDNLQRKLDDIGIIADLDSAKIWRLDLFKNVQTSYPYQAYRPVFEMLNLKRAKSRVYPEGYLTGNTYRELMFYNKIKELANKVGWHYVREVLNFSSETIARGELRFLKAKENQRNGIEYLKELPDKWDYLKEVYHSYMEQVFKYEFREGVLMDEETLNNFIKQAYIDLAKEGKEALSYWGFYPYTFLNKTDLLNALLEHFSRRQAYRILQQIDKSKLKNKANTLRPLYYELKDKFLERR